jgi:maltokinase
VTAGDPAGPDLSGLGGALAGWLPEQRWFAGKGSPVLGVTVAHAALLRPGDPGLAHAVVEVAQESGTEQYQLVLGLRDELPDYLAPARLGTVDGQECYDATHDPEAAALLLDLFRSPGDAGVGGVRFATEADADLATGLNARLIGAEQSNSSLVFGSQYILKVFRRPTPGYNRDLDLHRALHRVGCKHIADTLGWVHGEVRGTPTVFGLVQRFLPNAAEGWAMATASVRDLMAEADLHADEVGGDFASEAERLGEAVAAVHLDLATALGSQQATAADLAGLVSRMHRKLDEALPAVPELAPYAADLRAAFDAALGAGAVPVQHVHGDLHLGQVLRTPADGWVLIDFEGEPAAPAQERVALTPPLRDVAGMLRSFDYAAFQMRINDTPDNPLDHQLTIRAAEWARRNREAFLTGYAAVGADPRNPPELLRAFELEKAVYEVHYEHDNRPDWLPIPLGAIARLLG